MRLDQERIRVELRVLAIAIAYPQHIDPIVSRTRATDYFLGAHWRAMELLAKLKDGGHPIGDFTGIVLHELLRARIVTTDGQPDTISESALIEARMSAVNANVERYINQIVSFGTADSIAAVAAEMKRQSEIPHANHGAVMDQALAKIKDIQARQSVNVRKLSSIGEEAVEQFKTEIERGVSGAIKTGISTLDDMTGGIKHGALTVVGARSSEGKTSFAMQLLERASSQKLKCLFVSIELPGVDVFKKSLTMGGVVDPDAFNGDLTQEVIGAARSEVVTIKYDRDYAVYANAKATASDIRAAVVYCKEHYGVQMVVVDYLGDMERCESDKYAKPMDVIANNAKAMRSIAREFGCALVLLAQLNRKSGDTDLPKLIHLAGSDKVGNHADMVWLIKNPKDGTNGVRDATLVVEKNRNGQTGNVALKFDPARTVFFEAEE